MKYYFEFIMYKRWYLYIFLIRIWMGNCFIEIKFVDLDLC